MLKRIFKKLNSKRKEKKGASLAIVVTTMSLLIVLGSTCCALAFQSYRYSYGALCRQQAMFTAKGVLDSVVEEFKDNYKLRGYVIDALNNQILLHPDKEYTALEAQINIKDLHDYMADTPGGGGDFDFVTAAATAGENPGSHDNYQDCFLIASYGDNNKKKIKLKVAAKYKGFSESLSCSLAYTNKASVELTKILGNTLYFISPIINFVCDGIDGDVYVDKDEYGDNNGNGVDDFYENIRAEQAVLLGSGEVYDSGHTLYMDIDGNPTQTPQEWVEVYIRTWKFFSDPPVVIRGNLKCNTDVLLGLVDRSSKGADHGYPDSVGFDGLGQAPYYTCLNVRDDIYVNGNARGENVICKNLYVVDNDEEDGVFKGNLVMQLKTGALGYNSYLEVHNNIVADGYVKINGGTSGKIGGSIYAGKYNADGTKWGTPDNGNVILNKVSVNGNIYATGDVILTNCTVGGKIYAGGKVVLNSSTVGGNVIAQGDFEAYFSGYGKEDIVKGNVVSGGNVRFENSGTGTAGYKYIVGNLFAKGDINMDDRAVVGHDGSKSSIYCGGDLVMDDYCSVDGQYGYVYVKGDFRVYDSWVKCRVYVEGNFLTDNTWLYENIYAIGWVKASGKASKFQNNGKYAYSNNVSGSDITKLYNTPGNRPQELTTQTGIFSGGRFTVRTVEDEEWFAKLDKEIEKNIRKAKSGDISERLEKYSKMIALIRKWSSPKPSDIVNGDNTVGGAYYPDVHTGISVSNTNYLVEGTTNQYEIKNNVLEMTEFSLPANSTLTIDTSMKNIHITLKCDMIIGANSKIVVKGSSMAFIYIEKDNAKIDFASGSQIGLVQAVGGGSTDNAGLYIISNTSVNMSLGNSVEIRSFNYLPYGTLSLKASANTTYRGAFVLGYVDLGTWTNSVLNASYITYNGEKSPLILDGTNDMQFGDDPNEVIDFGTITWEITEYS